MKNIYVTATDIDFSRYIGEAFRNLITNEDFLSAVNEDRKAAICHIANAFAMSNSVLRGYPYEDYTDYLLLIVKVSEIKPKEDYLDVMYTYCPYTKEVY